MHLSSLNLLTAALAGLATTASASNAHKAGSRRAHHFGKVHRAVEPAQQEAPVPPPGAQVFKSSVGNPNVAAAAGNASAVALAERGLEKRAFTGRATFYSISDNAGACGQMSYEPAYIVALNTAQYGGGYPGPECFKTVTITGGSRNGHAVAQIMDECPTCPYGALDLGKALFANFASEDEGVTEITWWFNEGGNPEPTTSKPPPPPPTSTTPEWTPPATSSTPEWTPEPTSEWQPPSSSWTPEPTTSWTPEPTTSWTPEPSTSTTPTSTWVEPTTSSTWSSSIATSSSSIVSANATSSTLLNLGKNMTATATGTAGQAAGTAVAGAAGFGGSGGAAAGGPRDANGNLEMLSEVTLQLGNIIVLSAQKNMN